VLLAVVCGSVEAASAYLTQLVAQMEGEEE
jgi:hypothetical protein